MEIIDIGANEAFADGHGLVISWRGENFYKGCGHPVKTTKHGTSHCVKPRTHPTHQHEDFFGNVTN